MAPTQEPMTDEEIDELREKMTEQREEIREYLAEQGVDTEAWDESAVEARADGGDR